MAIRNINSLPTCTVIVLNYNGKRLIKEVLDNLATLNYPKDRYDVVVVDNNSSDGSQAIIESYINTHKRVSYLPSKLNGGFAYGNNLAIRKTKSKYVALLNNDCLVDKNWLTELVNVAESNPRIFAVNSKIILYPKRCYLSILTNNLTSVELLNSKLFDYQSEKSLSLNWQPSENGPIISVPFSPRDTMITIRIKISLTHKKPENLIVEPLSSNYKMLAKHTNANVYELSLDLKKLSKFKHNLVQNAGSFIFQDGYGRDIGAAVVPGIQDYEIDKGQYNESREVFSCCAASCLYRKSILNKIGSLDETFFMYYEDTELSWRARILGYRNLIAPKSLVRHFHSLSSKEWSPFFISHVEYGRLLCLFYSAPTSVFVKELWKFTVRSFGHAGRYLIWRNSNDLLNIQTLLKFLYSFPKNLIHKINKYSDFPNYKIRAKSIYKEITQGRWYFQ